MRDSIVSDNDLGVLVTLQSRAGVVRSVVEGNREARLYVRCRSEAIAWDGIFRHNGQVHVGTSDRSDVTLLGNVVVGAEEDDTWYSLTASRKATVSSYSSPVIHGNVGAVDEGKIGVGNTVVHGDVHVRLFSKAQVRDGEITGMIVCRDASDAVCERHR